MRTTVAICLLVLLSLTQTPIGQVVKLPFLVEHYYKHRKVEDVSLMRFLVDHYSGQHRDADRSEDEQLPFKMVVLQSMAAAVLPTVVTNELSVKRYVPEKILCRQNYFPRQHLASIFHPPRV